MTMKRTGRPHFKKSQQKKGTWKAGKMEVIYNIKTFTTVTLVVSNSSIPNCTECIKIQLAFHFFRANLQLKVRFTFNGI